MKLKYSYRITKYFEYTPCGRFLTSNENDWTSYCEVPKKVSLEEYLITEQKYIDIVLSVCKRYGIGCLRVSKKDPFSNVPYRNKDLISFKDLPDFIRGILREEFWCKLKHKKCEFHFGYDYYMYCVAESDIFSFLKDNSTLHIERYPSPYRRKNGL